MMAFSLYLTHPHRASQNMYTKLIRIRNFSRSSSSSNHESSHRPTKFTFGLPQLSTSDHSNRLKFASTMLEKLDGDSGLIHRIVFSDEGNFWPMTTTSTSTNSSSSASATNANRTQNVRRNRNAWKKKPYAESPPLPSIAWCGMTTKQVIGPYFFNAHVTESSYLSMLRKYFLPQLLRRQLPVQETWFQQDGAPPHRSKSVLQLLTSTFGSRLISYGAGIQSVLKWPARSQDLTPLDYFFWDYMKEKMKAYRPSTHENLRECLHFEMSSLDPNVLDRFVHHEFIKRLKKCVEVGGKRFELEPESIT